MLGSCHRTGIYISKGAPAILILITQRIQHALTPSASTSRIVELDALRGIAALAVVFYHFTLRYDQIYGHTSGLPFHVSAGRYGVELFFIISGFVILMSLEKTARIQDFVVKRIIRLYPVYWVAIAITFALVSIFGLPGREVSVYHALLNGLMVHPFLGGISNVDGVYWTLFIEFLFYVVMATVYVLRLVPHIEWVATVWITIITLEHHNLLNISERLGPWLILGYGYLFIIGMMLYRIHKEGESVIRYSLIAACVASQVSISVDIERHITVFVLIMVFALVNAGKLRAIAIPPLLALGRISYPLYLIHQNIGYMIIRGLEGHGVSPAVSIISAISCTIAIATFMTRYIEQPILAVLKQQYRTHKPSTKQ